LLRQIRNGHIITDVSEDPIQVVITGAGLVTPLGLSRQETWQAVLDMRCGIRSMPAMESPLPPGADGGQAPDLPADFHPTLPRETRYLRRAIDEAIDDAKLGTTLPYSPDRCGIVLGTTLHGMRKGGKYLRTGDLTLLQDFLAGPVLKGAVGPVGQAFLPAGGADIPVCPQPEIAPSGQIRMSAPPNGLDLAGCAITTCSACSSSLGAIALAVTLLRSGQLDLVIAGGYDTISEYVYAGFNSLRLVAGGPLRPFARDRQGMKLAEGYGIVVLERADEAQRRGANILATVLGYGESADAHHLTQPHPKGEGATRAIRDALADAKVEPDAIGLIAAHATGTIDNDAGEYAAFSAVFGDCLPSIPVVAFKSHLGHTLGGAGVVELILSAMALRDQIIPACVNVSADQIGFPGLNLATEKRRPGKIAATLNTSLGFGGANTCMILGPAPIKQSGILNPPRPTALNEVFITAIGVVFPGIIGNDAFARRLSGPAGIDVDTGNVCEADIADLLNARRVRRMSDYVKVSLAAAALCIRDAGIEDVPQFMSSCAAILGTAHGSSTYCESYYRQIVNEGIAAANPMLFAEGVPNAAAAHLSLMLNLKGPCQTVIGSRTAGLDALRLAAARIATGRWRSAIVGAAEEYCPVVNAAYGAAGVYGPAGFVAGAGAVAFLLENRESIESRHSRPHARIDAADGAMARPHGLPRLARRIIRSLGQPDLLITSANGTWIDRLVKAGISKRARTECFSPYGYIAECYSVMPLAGIAGVLLTGRAGKIAALAADYTGAISGVSVERCDL
jgi:3-oxoacyl-[acyl-carrier-protein] synthase II